MSWGKVGSWLADNVGSGASLVGALLTGGTSAAVAMGISMVADATGTNDPDKALEALKNNPEMVIRLEELKNERKAEVNRHIETMEKAKLDDKQAEHSTTANVTMNGDNAEGGIKWIRPLQSTASLIAGMVYCVNAETINFDILGLWLALPWGYAGLRQFGKWKTRK